MIRYRSVIRSRPVSSLKTNIAVSTNIDFETGSYVEDQPSPAYPVKIIAVNKLETNESVSAQCLSVSETQFDRSWHSIR